MIFPNLAAVPENADIFQSEEFSPNWSDSMSVSIQVNTTLMTDKVNGTIRILGSNISGNAADMVPVKDEDLSNAARVVTLPFVRNSFPFKWIGIQYLHNTNAGSGTFSVMIEKKVNRVNIA
jgi:hypothetical protein